MGGRLPGLTLPRCVRSLGRPESGLDGLKQGAVPGVRGLKLCEMAPNVEILSDPAPAEGAGVHSWSGPPGAEPPSLSLPASQLSASPFRVLF